MNKNDFIMFRLRPQTKEALRDYSKDNQLSMSEALRDFMQDRLKQFGYIKPNGRKDKIK